MTDRTKQEIRNLMKVERDRLTPEVVEEKSRRICEKLAHYLTNYQYNYLASFFPLGNEVDVVPLLQKWLAEKRILFFPKVQKKNQLEIYRVEKLDQLEKGAFGLREPNSDLPTPKQMGIQVEVILVPGLAFSEKGHRVGFGKGYYDRFLQHYPNALKIGLFYEFQRFPNLPTEPFDLGLNLIITEEKVEKIN